MIAGDHEQIAATNDHRPNLDQLPLGHQRLQELRLTLRPHPPRVALVQHQLIDAHLNDLDHSGAPFSRFDRSAQQTGRTVETDLESRDGSQQHPRAEAPRRTDHP